VSCFHLLSCCLSYAECRTFIYCYAVCRYAQSPYGDCRGAQNPSSVKILVFACSAAERIQTEKGPVLQNFLLQSLISDGNSLECLLLTVSTSLVQYLEA